MFERLGSFAVRRRIVVLVGTGVFFAAAGVIGGGVAERLSNGGFQDPNAESVRAEEALEAEFGVRTPNLVLLVTATGGSVDDPAIERAGLALSEELAGEEGVGQVLSYWATGIPALKSEDGESALIAARIAGDEDVVRDRVEEISPHYSSEGPGYRVAVGGFAEIFRQVGETIEEDLVRAETIAFPITLILLIFVFGSLVAAGLPLLIGGISIVGSFLILTIIAEMTQVSIFALNLVTAMGLGLAIDYSLFIVSRFREEMRNGLEPHDAVVKTVQTAGRTVAFSGVTVGLSLAALLVFPLAFLRSFAYAGVAVVVLAVIASTLFLPSLLAVLGPRVDKLSWRRHRPGSEEAGFWHRMATTVMRRPIPIATIVVAFLLFLGVPFLDVQFGLPDDRVLPDDASSHQVSQVIRDDFEVDATNNVNVVVPDAGDLQQRAGEVEAYAQRLSEIDEVFAVQAVTGTYVDGRKAVEPSDQNRIYRGEDATWFTVVPDVDPNSPAGERLVTEIRALDAPFDVLVGGPSADLVDSKEGLFGRMPLAAALIGITTFVLLFLMFGGILVPVKAIVLNLLSLTATFGALVWVFQQGHLSDTLDFTVTGTIDATNPILMFCIAFGLSMDYEVFLLSRIKEEYDLTGDNALSVAWGLEHTGRIVTAAAATLSVVFIAIATSQVTFIKLMGVGLTLAVIMDATLIRAVLVPAFMRLAGRANWWAPQWMRRIHDRFGISESDSPRAPIGGPAPASEGGAG
jgi:RND superfamily putative drug exporter